MLQMLLDDFDVRGGDLSSVRSVIYSAAPMPLPLLQRALVTFRGCAFFNLYGQTEICMFCLPSTQHLPQGSPQERERLKSVGQVYPNTLAKVIDENGNECAVNTPGEIVARSVAMFRGYWNNHPATLETLRNGWCHTGDIGRIDADGFLYLVDRKKDVIISGGENIYSREVEIALLQHPAIAECAVIGVPDARWGESVCAVVVIKQGMSTSDEDLIAHVQSLIASYKKPRLVIRLETLPKLVTGKINKLELRSRYGNTSSRPA
jgi:acyl-CoA synthetase (AMP-forming)/AMP-acid ligase II